MKKIKYLFYLFILLFLLFLYWFLPKYSYIAKNPGYCVALTKNLYFCGNNAGLDNLFGEQKN